MNPFYTLNLTYTDPPFEFTLQLLSFMAIFRFLSRVRNGFASHIGFYRDELPLGQNPLET
jgi:hypothetical protein